jgi:hypothetical protein
MAVDGGWRTSPKDDLHFIKIVTVEFGTLKALVFLNADIFNIIKFLLGKSYTHEKTPPFYHFR